MQRKQTDPNLKRYQRVKPIERNGFKNANTIPEQEDRNDKRHNTAMQAGVIA